MSKVALFSHTITGQLDSMRCFREPVEHGIRLGTSCVVQKWKSGFFTTYFSWKSGKNKAVFHGKSGKDYTVHRALNTFLSNPAYRVARAFVLSNTREIRQEGAVTYLPVYFAMFLRETPPAEVMLG